MKNPDFQVAQEKMTAAAELIQAAGADMWLILTREGSDPALPLMVGTRSIHEAAMMILPSGRHAVLCSQSDRGNYASTDLFAEVIVYEKDFAASLRAQLEQRNPQRLMLNFSTSDALSDGLTVGQYLLLEEVLGAERLRAVEMSSEAVLKQLRSQKSPAELARVQKAVDLTLEIYAEVFSKLRCGLTEKQIGEMFVAGMRARGVTSGTGAAYDMPIVCLVRCGLAHRQPGDNPAQPGDILIMDFSVRHQNYVSDIARTVYFLKPGETQAPPDVQHAFDTAHRAISAVIDSICPGQAGWEVDATGRRVVEAGGFPTVRHSVGHQIGRNCHDGGTLLGPRRSYPRPDVETQVQAGELYAIEPTVIQDGGLPCMLVEENVLITDSGARLLSRRQNELVLVACTPEGA
ncbi:MAG TPA: Xaa-Pro peptidase family protein [Anaerolineaceae bacterium]|nr:Xaa-Pro peptidase family protein [Anaerolineaceae bacterium]